MQKSEVMKQKYFIVCIVLSLYLTLHFLLLPDNCCSVSIPLLKYIL